jgi:hypothetical protein
VVLLHMVLMLQELLVDLVAAVVVLQPEQHQEFNHNKLTQVGHNMEILVDLEEPANGMAVEAVALMVLEKLLQPVAAETVALEKTSLNSLQHLVMVDISVAVAAVAVINLMVRSELVELVAVEMVVVMKV